VKILPLVLSIFSESENSCEVMVFARGDLWRRLWRTMPPVRSTTSTPQHPANLGTTGGTWATFRARLAAQREIFRRQRTEYIVKYGGSFFVVHELLGISSYVVVYSLVSTGVIDVWKVIRFVGWNEEILRQRLGKTWEKFQSKTEDLREAQKELRDLAAPGDVKEEISVVTELQEKRREEEQVVKKRSKMVDFAMTVAIVKTLDVFGLVPLRYLITFTVTPRVARVIGPSVDRVFDRLRKFVRRRPAPAGQQQ